jgi:hypothetical protein
MGHMSSVMHIFHLLKVIRVIKIAMRNEGVHYGSRAQ